MRKFSHWVYRKVMVFRVAYEYNLCKGEDGHKATHSTHYTCDKGVQGKAVPEKSSLSLIMAS